MLLIPNTSSKWLSLNTRFIYSDPDTYIATLPEPNNERLVFESMPAYKPVLGTPSTDGVPIVARTVDIAAEFAPVCRYCGC